MKNELVGKIMAECAALRTKFYNYLRDDNEENKKQKAQKSIS